MKLKSFTGMSGNKNPATLKFKKYKKNQASTKQGWTFMNFPNPGGEISVNRFNNSVGDATGVGTSSGAGLAGAGESLDDTKHVKLHEENIMNDFEFDETRLDDETYWDELYKQFDGEEDENTDYVDFEHDHDPQDDYIVNELDKRLDWIVKDGMCSKPILEAGKIIIDCDPELEVLKYVRDIIKEVCDGTSAKIDENGYQTIISFNESLAEAMCGYGSLYTPTDETIAKLRSRMESGSRENIKAISSENKLYSYYHAAVILGWDQLKNAIRDMAENETGKFMINTQLLDKIDSCYADNAEDDDVISYEPTEEEIGNGEDEWA